MLTIAPGLPVLTPDAMRAAEAAAIAAGTPALRLMERAAAAAVRAILAWAPGRDVLVLCGPGNNGGDGYGVAVGLKAAGLSVRVAAMGPARGEVAGAMAARWTGPVAPLATAGPAPIIVDALFGTGFRGALPDEVDAALARFRGSRVVALDIVSGVDATTGGAGGRPLAADMTLAFGAIKRGHVLGPGRALAGRLVCADIGVAVMSSVALVTTPVRRPLPSDTHKYRRGWALVIEGDPRRGGAARLTALAALRAGAGAVTITGPGEGAPAAAIMRRDDTEGAVLLGDGRLGAAAVGPGLAADDRSRAWLARLLAGTVPVVVDAGALALASVADLANARAPLVLTPHAGEFTKLFGAIGDDPVAAAQAAAIAAGAVVVLKGTETVVAAPDGRVGINTHASAWLATAGSGDVLTGIVVALLATGMTPFDAARAAVWLHGDAGLRGGPGLIADDLPALLPVVLAAL